MNNNIFKKKEHPDVYSILVYQCEKALEAAILLDYLMRNIDTDTADKIEEIENKADEKRADLTHYVENTYITPMDRRDLYALSRTLDDITDSITDLKDFIMYFNYQAPENALSSIHLIIESITALTNTMKEWQALAPADFLQNLKIVVKNETASRRLFWKTINEISKDASSREILIEKEFCHDLNALAAIASKASDRMGDLKIKSIK